MSSRLLKGILIGFLTGIVGLIASILPAGYRLEENAGLDLMFRLRGERQPPPDVVVVSIDRESSENLNLPDNPDKWPRSLHARLTENLVREGAKVIAFDLHFIEPRSAGDDNLFSEAIQRARNCVLCEPLKAKEIPLSNRGGSPADVHSIVKIVKPIALFADPAAATAPFVLPRIPFKVNQYWTFQTGAGDSPTLPVVVFQIFSQSVYGDFIRLMEKVSPDLSGRLPRDFAAAIEAKEVKGLVRTVREAFEAKPLMAEKMLTVLEDSDSPADEKRRQMIKVLIRMYQGTSSRYINFYGPPRTITTLPYFQALQLRDGAVGGKRVDLKGKAVFVGLSEVMLAERKDSFYTVYSQANGIFVSGVEIAATAFANLLEERPLKPLPLHFFILAILLWGILLGTLCHMLPITSSALTAIGLSLLYLAFSTYQFKTGDTWYPTVIPLLLQAPLAFFAAVVWNYVDVNKERQNIKKALGYHLPKEVVDQIAKDVVQIETESQVVYGICLFTDVEQYTALSEKLSPAELGRLMNRYYESIFKPVKEQKGYISGVIGDAMLAIWATTSSEASLKKHACLAAIEIRKELNLFNQSSDAPNLKTRIGVHCGQILLGHIGALDHYEYTPMGDIVNTAARIEGLNKYLGTGTLVSDEIIGQVNGFLSREMGTFKVAGKVKPISVHELIGHRDECGDKRRQTCAAFAEAREAFKRQSWAEAGQKFHQIIDRFGEDGPSQFYIKLCEHYQNSPPGQSWDGVIQIEKK